MTKVLAVDGVPNCGKSFFVEEASKVKDIKVKVMKETARQVMDDFPGIEDDMDTFQEIIHARETERVHEIKRDVKSQLYDLILVDRTSLSGWIFQVFNEDMGVTKKTISSILHKDLYNQVFLFTKPIGQYKGNVEGFKNYDNPHLGELFDKYITLCYPGTEKFDNYVDNYTETNRALYDLLEKPMPTDTNLFGLMDKIGRDIEKFNKAGYKKTVAELSLLRRQILTGMDSLSALEVYREIAAKRPFIL